MFLLRKWRLNEYTGHKWSKRHVFVGEKYFYIILDRNIKYLK